MKVPDSTLSGVVAGRSPVSTWARRIFLVLLVCLIGLGLLGQLGVRTETVRDTGGGYRLEVDYPRVARAGLDVPFRFRVTEPGGFHGKPIVIDVSSHYFEIFEAQGVTPEPSKETNDGEMTELTFDPPSGDTLEVDYDQYVQPAAQRGKDATVSVMDQGSPVAQVGFTTTLMP